MRRHDPMPEPLIGWLLLALAVFSAVPFGGNRPTLWFIHAACSFLAGGALLLAGARRGTLVPAGPGGHPRRDLLIPGVACLAWAAGLVALQVLPGLGLVDAPWNVDPANSLAGAFRQAGTLVFGLACLQSFRRRRRSGRVALALLVAIAAHAAFGFLGLRLDAIVLPGEAAYPGYLTGAFVNRNSFATLVGIGLALDAALLVSPLPWRRSWIGRMEETLWRAGLAAIGLFLVAALVATGSRMGMMASACGLLALGLGLLARGPGSWRQAAAFCGPAILLPILFALRGEVLFDRFVDLGDGIDQRLALYRVTLEMIASAPWTGAGLDNFAEAFRFHQDLTVNPDLRWEDAHSSYLENWVELGIPAGSLPAIIGVLLLARILGRIRSTRGADAIPLAALGAVVTGAVHSLADFSLEIQGVLLPLVLLIGLALGPAPAASSGAAGR
ncbi:O-antigen ligase family protein [Cereibacter sphaeroides]|uniref:O-antigen ligase family protein n=1 Tax=Cereibacter sphaeroides TaxID=1063 RepID=UPI001F25BD60|nr:O-antigen ligase family protein [Cereibacter sphaeroides]MCE6959235.1 O-antigen ligase family protein [Cereibacter sphaeroides]MCE6972038.1 O-antigen ligase family protein [Cereibacter sphaeroides]